METPGGEIRASQEGSGKLRLDQRGELGEGRGGSPRARTRLAHLAGARRAESVAERGHKARVPAWEGREARARYAARELFVCALCSPFGPAPTPPPARAPAPPPPTLRVSGSQALRGDRNLGLFPAPCARLLCALREHG